MVCLSLAKKLHQVTRINTSTLPTKLAPSKEGDFDKNYERKISPFLC